MDYDDLRINDRIKLDKLMEQPTNVYNIENKTFNNTLVMDACQLKSCQTLTLNKAIIENVENQ